MCQMYVSLSASPYLYEFSYVFPPGSASERLFDKHYTCVELILAFWPLSQVHVYAYDLSDGQPA